MYRLTSIDPSCSFIQKNFSNCPVGCTGRFADNAGGNIRATTAHSHGEEPEPIQYSLLIFLLFSSNLYSILFWF